MLQPLDTGSETPPIRHALLALAWIGDAEVQRRQDVGAEAHARGDTLTAMDAAVNYGRDRIIGTYRIVSEREDRKGRRLYRLEPTELPT